MTIARLRNLTFRKGDEIKAADLELLRKEIIRLNNVTTTGNMTVSHTAQGVHLIDSGSAGNPLKRGRLDGTLETDGTAEVSLYSWDGTNWGDSGDNVTARVGLPISSTISTNQIVWVTKVSGDWFVVLAECS